MSPDVKKMVEHKVTQWNKEAALHFCRLAQRDTARFQNVVYPTGLKMVRVSCHVVGEAAEVHLRQAKELRANGFKVIC